MHENTKTTFYEKISGRKILSDDIMGYIELHTTIKLAMNRVLYTHVVQKDHSITI